MTTALAPTSAARRWTRRTRRGWGSRTGSRVRSIAEGLTAIEEIVVGVGTGEHGHVVGRQPAPQLPQVRLDAADLRGEVVGDQQVSGHEGEAAGPPDADRDE